MNIGLLHPGAMGVSIGQSLLDNQHTVYWASAGRSKETTERAKEFRDTETLANLCHKVEGIISICPPEYAVDTAKTVAAQNFSGLYVDANAISPGTAAEVQGIIGDQYVDGGVIGPPAHHPGTTRLYLSGDRANEVSAWFEQGPLDARVLNTSPLAASALKMCFAAWTKGSAALLLNVRALADATGVAADLLAEWEISQPGLGDRANLSAIATAPKAWRFVAEMEEIAATFSEAGLTGAFHEGAAHVYERMSEFKGMDNVPEESVSKSLIGKEE